MEEIEIDDFFVIKTPAGFLPGKYQDMDAVNYVFGADLFKLDLTSVWNFVLGERPTNPRVTVADLERFLEE